jgi:hypothetical protein
MPPLQILSRLQTEQAARLMQKFTEDETAVSSENLSGPPSHVFLDMLLTEQRDEDLELLDVDNVRA